MAQGSIIGVDLGGTKGIVARYDAKTFERLQEERMATEAEAGFQAVLEDVIGLVEKLRTKDTKAIGIGLPGLVKQPEGLLLHTPNISGGVDIPVKDILEKRLGLPVHVGNDANCFALAEARMGRGKGKKVVVGITFGTGVGGGIVIDGKIFEGAHGYAAEIGHMLMMPGRPPYETDDKRGEVEQFLSGTAMGKRCTEATKPEDYLEGAVCSFMRPDIYREVAWLCTNLLYLLDPDIILFGGGAGYSLGNHLNEINAELKKWLLPRTPLPEIAISSIKDAGVLGAALLCA